MERDIENCGECREYPCKKLDFIFKNAPDTKKTLDRIRAGG
jgi:hypothetical protein